jgi:hypothetical protein
MTKFETRRIRWDVRKLARRRRMHVAVDAMASLTMLRMRCGVSIVRVMLVTVRMIRSRVACVLVLFAALLMRPVLMRVVLMRVMLRGRGRRTGQHQHDCDMPATHSCPCVYPS